MCHLASNRVSLPFSAVSGKAGAPAEPDPGADGRTTHARSVRVPRSAGAPPSTSLVSVHAAMGMGADEGARLPGPQAPVGRQGIPGEARVFSHKLQVEYCTITMARP